MLRASLFLPLALVLALSSAASAQSTPDTRPLLPVRLEGHGTLNWDGGAGVGGRVDIPVIKDGVIYNARDELAISVGLDVVFLAFEGSNPVDVWPTATVQWTLGVSDRFVFYPELGLSALIDQSGWRGMFPNVGFGGRYYFWRSVSVVGRLGWPMAISAGVTF
jgi:hypothetical protein